MKIGAITAPARELSWDGEFWGVRIAQADHPDVDDWAREHAVGCLFLLLDTGEIERIHQAEERGFRMMDIRVELEVETYQSNAFGTRLVLHEDIVGISDLARRSHRLTRFYADPRFPDSRCDDLYEGWIQNSVAGWADAVYVTGPLGAPTGYVTIHIDDDRDSSSLGLIAIAENARGQGLGQQLVFAVLNHAREQCVPRMRVVTQARNAAALRLFERCGFRIVKTHVWLHKWLTD